MNYLLEDSYMKVVKNQLIRGPKFEIYNALYALQQTTSSKDGFTSKQIGTKLNSTQTLKDITSRLNTLRKQGVIELVRVGTVGDTGRKHNFWRLTGNLPKKVERPSLKRENDRLRKRIQELEVRISELEGSVQKPLFTSGSVI